MWRKVLQKSERRPVETCEGMVRVYAGMPLMNGIPETVRTMDPVQMDRCLSETDGMLGSDQYWGVGVVELLLILIILIALVAIFKTQLTSLVNTILSRITTNANSVMR